MQAQSESTAHTRTLCILKLRQHACGPTEFEKILMSNAVRATSIPVAKGAAASDPSRVDDCTNHPTRSDPSRVNSVTLFAVLPAALNRRFIRARAHGSPEP